LPPEFHPLFRNPHLLTIAGNFWPREIDLRRFPARRVGYQVDPKNTVIAWEHQPEGIPRGQFVLLHGLEGSADAGYFASFSQEALTRGFGVHRLNMRTCGGTEEHCETMYHSGLTGDPLTVLRQVHRRQLGPLFLVGFSLGGNVALKLGGELGSTDLLCGIAAVSTPIDLARAVRAIDRPANTLYVRRFLNRLRDRVRRKSLSSPGSYNVNGLDEVKTIWEFDDRFTAPLFGFGTAQNYYATQSAVNFLAAVRVPTLIIAAQDDPLVPFEMYERPVFQTNPALRLLAPRYGGHLGFLSRDKPRFWIDQVVLSWAEQLCCQPRSLVSRS